MEHTPYSKVKYSIWPHHRGSPSFLNLALEKRTSLVCETQKLLRDYICGISSYLSTGLLKFTIFEIREKTSNSSVYNIH